jgi:hypothetical protein
MLNGSCVLTYNWGNNFKRYLEPGTQLRGKYGVAPMPGSTVVLDRDTMELVDCSEDICKRGLFYDDLGWVNKAPYMAYGGWGCAVNNYTDPKKKRLATEFCAFSSRGPVSTTFIIPNALSPNNETQNGQDPYRPVHLDIDRYVEQGYERATTALYVKSILYGLNHENVVIDIRFPTASQIMSILDFEFHDYLNATFLNLIPVSEREARRKQVVDSITTQWMQVINTYDAAGTTEVDILESYQRLMGVYVKDVKYTRINKIRGFGFSLATLLIVSALAFALWTFAYRESRVIKASQPFFLIMICVGIIVLASTMIVMGIDDTIASTRGASMACMAAPWLVSMGWTIVFSALYAKLRRVNMVYENSLKFRRLKVTEKDVLFPFVILLSLNLIFLIIWTVLDPVTWVLFQRTDLDFFATCTNGDDGSNVWKACFVCVCLANGIALILANIEAYKARHISTEYGESKYIAMSMGSIFQIVLVGLPSLFLVRRNPSATYFLRSGMVFVVSASILYLMFIPKLFAWFTNNDRTHQSQSRTSGLTYWIWDVKVS